MLDHDGGHLAASVVLSHHLYSIFVCRSLLLLVITILFLHILLWWWPRHPQTSNHQDFAFQELKGNIRVFCRYFPSFLSFWRYLTCKFTTQASTIAGGWKGRRGGYQARKYSGWHIYNWAWKIQFYTFCWYKIFLFRMRRTWSCWKASNLGQEEPTRTSGGSYSKQEVWSNWWVASTCLGLCSQVWFRVWPGVRAQCRYTD